MIRHTARAGTEEKQDAVVTVAPGTDIQIAVEKAPHPRFQESIRRCVFQTLEELSVEAAHITVRDFGALDFVLQARVRAAVRIAEEG